jgi:hypothetical protein
MEINYDTIIKYLTKNLNTFSNKKNILTYSDKFCTKFSNLLQNKFYKYGITINDDKNKNISFYTSLLTLLNKDFVSFDNNEEINEINKFKIFINDSIKSFNPSIYLKNYLNENKLVNSDLLNNLDIYYFQTIVEIFDINMLILDFNDENIYTLYPDDEYNPWKPTLVFAKYNEWWEPIICELKTKRTFSYNDCQIKKLLTESKIEYYHKDIIKKEFKMNDNINNIINELKPKETELEVDGDTLNNSTFIKVEKQGYDFITLNKLTKNDLSDICKTNNIKINTKMLKKELIDLIMNN